MVSLQCFRCFLILVLMQSSYGRRGGKVATTKSTTAKAFTRSTEATKRYARRLGSNGKGSTGNGKGKGGKGKGTRDDIDAVNDEGQPDETDGFDIDGSPPDGADGSLPDEIDSRFSSGPSLFSSNLPSSSPSLNETVSPTEVSTPSSTPTEMISSHHSGIPTPGPTPTPTPTLRPTHGPTRGPTLGPTSGPTLRPTTGPTKGQTPGPTQGSTQGPTPSPSSGQIPEPTGPAPRPSSGIVSGPTTTPTTDAMGNSMVPTSSIDSNMPQTQQSSLTLEPSMVPTPSKDANMPQEQPTSLTVQPSVQPSPITNSYMPQTQPSSLTLEPSMVPTPSKDANMPHEQPSSSFPSEYSSSSSPPSQRPSLVPSSPISSNSPSTIQMMDSISEFPFVAPSTSWTSGSPSDVTSFSPDNSVSTPPSSLTDSLFSTVSVTPTAAPPSMPPNYSSIFPSAPSTPPPTTTYETSTIPSVSLIPSTTSQPTIPRMEGETNDSEEGDGEEMDDSDEGDMDDEGGDMDINETVDGVWACEDADRGIETTVNVDFQYRIWTANALSVNETVEEVEHRMTEKVAEELLALCNSRNDRRLRKQAPSTTHRQLMDGVIRVSASPEDEVSDSCGTDCYFVKGYITVGSSEPETSDTVKTIFCEVIEIIANTQVLTIIATTMDGVQGLMFDQTTMSCFEQTSTGNNDGVSAVTEEEKEVVDGQGGGGGGGSTNIYTIENSNTGTVSIGLVIAGALVFILVFIIARRRHARHSKEEYHSSDDEMLTAIVPEDAMIAYPTRQREMMIDHREMIQPPQARKQHHKRSTRPSHIAALEDTTWQEMTASFPGSASVVSAVTMPSPLGHSANNGEYMFDKDEERSSDEEEGPSDEEEDDIVSIPKPIGEDSESSWLGVEPPSSPVSVGEDIDDDDDDYDIIVDLEAMIEDAEPVDLSSMVRPPQQTQHLSSDVNNRSFRQHNFSSPGRSLTPIRELDDESSSLTSSITTAEANSRNGMSSPPISPQILDAKTPDPTRAAATKNLDTGIYSTTKLGVHVAQFVGGDVKLLDFPRMKDYNQVVKKGDDECDDSAFEGSI